MKTMWIIVRLQFKIWSMGFWSLETVTRAIYSGKYQLSVSYDGWMDILCDSKWTCLHDDEEECCYHLSIWELYDLVKSFIQEWLEDPKSNMSIHPVTMTAYERSMEAI